MKKLLLFIILPYSSALTAPEPIDRQPSSINSSKNYDQYFPSNVAPHEPVKEFDNRSPFEQAIKNRDLENARQMFTNIQNSYTTTEEFAKPLVERYNNTRGKITDLYSGTTMDEARNQLMQDLHTINPHLAKTFRDSFKVKPQNITPQTRNDDAYFHHLDQNPDQITVPFAIHEHTPFETAVLTGNKKMADRIAELAKKHKIAPNHLVDPLVNEYKKILQTEGSKGAHAFANKIYDLQIKRISEIFHKKIKNL
ncbi:hypothetical protein A3J41_01715 [candidate division TM6 bacterium RIFCSPHIGHO2_12_FULL_38_8]|nr:MAG: hypothetical protein A3J41_01715 [candidate division TM6 bacterium RIFCSPHIGHO2_12_FULL_38_8]